jgi:hypothetical protein
MQRSTAWARWRLVSLLMLVMIAAACTDSKPESSGAEPNGPIESSGSSGGSGGNGGSGPTAPETPEPWTSESLVLQALKTYMPLEWKDGEATPPVPVRFTIPKDVRVTLGNSGNQLAQLRFRTPEGEEIACDYRGGSDIAHPGDAYQRAKGGRYHFEQCSDGRKADQSALGTWFQLHIADGDSQDPAALTQAEVRLGASMTELSPPISPEETVKIREAFSWKETKALPEQDAAGTPTLYYMIVYIEEREQVDGLDDMLVHYSTLPLFADEMARWEGQRGIFAHEGDGHGVFLFTLMPGAVYNLIRKNALEGSVLYTVIAPRDVPAVARLADGSVSYEALRASGFLYRDLRPSDVEGWSASGAPSPQPRGLFSGLRKIAKAIGKAGMWVVRGAVKVIGYVDRTIEGSADLTVRLDVRNIDPLFGVGTPMQRAWGAGAGQQVKLSGVRVSASQTVLGVIPTLFSKLTDANGAVHMKVARKKKTSICVAVENDAASVTRSLLAVSFCDFASVNGSQLGSSLDLPLALQHPYFNILAQAHEGRYYLKDVVGYDPDKAEILVGPLANLASGAATPCFGFSNMKYDALVSVLAESAALIPVVGPAISACIVAAGSLYAVDMIIPDHDKSSGSSRGIITHEYGHFSLCSLLHSQGPDNITMGYTDAMLKRISSGGDSGAGAESGYINEAFADFFAAQVAGGTNYFNSYRTTQVDEVEGCGIDSEYAGVYYSLGMCYCRADSGGTCMDSDKKYTSSFDSQVARVATTLHDAFDGAPSLPPQNTPGNADAWTMSGNVLAYSPTNRNGSAGDESVVLEGQYLRTLIAKWDARGKLLTQNNFLGGLADTMAAAGYDWCSRCKVFALHDERFDDKTNYADLCKQEPIASWIGPSPTSPIVTFQPGPEGKDAKVFSRPDVIDKNQGSDAYLWAMAWTWSGVPGTARSYLEFDLSSISPQTPIVKATLTLHPDMIHQPYGHSQQSGPNNGLLWRVAVPWDESTITWNNQPAVDKAAPVTLPPSTASNEIYVIDVTAMVKDMVKDPASNHGFMIQLATEQYWRALQFMSSDAADPAVRPRLDVTTVPPGCP